jgi:hypothetical protein
MGPQTLLPAAPTPQPGTPQPLAPRASQPVARGPPRSPSRDYRGPRELRPPAAPPRASHPPGRPSLAPAHCAEASGAGGLRLRPPEGPASRREGLYLTRKPCSVDNGGGSSRGRMSAGSDPVVIVSAARTAIGEWSACPARGPSYLPLCMLTEGRTWGRGSEEERARGLAGWGSSGSPEPRASLLPGPPPSRLVCRLRPSCSDWLPAVEPPRCPVFHWLPQAGTLFRDP